MWLINSLDISINNTGVYISDGWSPF